jgi:hypothetical protein
MRLLCVQGLEKGLGYAGMKGRAISGVGHEKCVTCVTLRAFSGIFFLV